MNTPNPLMNALPSIPFQLFPSFNPGPPPPLNLPAHLVTEAELLASMAAKALHNRGKLCSFTILFNLIPKSLSSIWMLTDMIYLCQRSLLDRIKLKKTDSVSHFACDPSCQDQLLTEPSIIVDCYGKILAWYLPLFLRRDSMDSLLSFYPLPLIRLFTIGYYLASSTGHGSFKGSLTSEQTEWQNHLQYYDAPRTCLPLPGNINLSPAWFQQGHDVHSVGCSLHKTLFTNHSAATASSAFAGGMRPR